VLLAADGISAEIVDPHDRPADRDAILASADQSRRRRRARPPVGWRRRGAVGDDAEEIFDDLRADHVATLDVPIPFSPVLGRSSSLRSTRS
jgi:pyruvate/2-oxoglutarate/acetoin dehydrogenase E1 component